MLTPTGTLQQSLYPPSACLHSSASPAKTVQVSGLPSAQLVSMFMKVMADRAPAALAKSGLVSRDGLTHSSPMQRIGPSHLTFEALLPGSATSEPQSHFS